MRHLKDYLTPKRHIIWDWNGTLLDDTHYAVHTIGLVLKEQALDPIDLDAYRQKFRFPVREYYIDLGFDFNRVAFEIVAERFIEHYNREVKTRCELFSGARDLLTELKSDQKGLHVLSAAHEKELLHLLDHHDIRHLFDQVCGLSDNFAASKIDRGRDLIASLNTPNRDIIMVGDTDHDIEVAHALGIDILLLGDGHQDVDRLHHAAKEKRGVGIHILNSRFE